MKHSYLIKYQVILNNEIIEKEQEFLVNNKIDIINKVIEITNNIREQENIKVYFKKVISIKQIY